MDFNVASKSKESPIFRKIRNYSAPIILDIILVAITVDAVETNDPFLKFMWVILMAQAIERTKSTYQKSLPYSARRQNNSINR